VTVFAQSRVAIEAIMPVSLTRWFQAIDALDRIAADPSFAPVHAIRAHAVDESSRMT
jgi:hypothetical protein